MPILFSVVACDRNMVSHFASCEGNFMEIAEQVLLKIPQCNKKMTYSHGTYLLHYIAEDSYVYFCITDKLCQRSRTFLFLNEIQRRFIDKERTKDDFTEVLAAEMYRYSEDYSTITIRKGELDELNKIGVGFSEDLLGEKVLFINNPENISYSVISYMANTPERIPYIGSFAEQISHGDTSDISNASSITKPTLLIDSSSVNEIDNSEQTSEDNNSKESLTTENSVLQEKSNVSNITKPRLSEGDTSKHEADNIEQISQENRTADQLPTEDSTLEAFLYGNDTSEQTACIASTPTELSSETTSEQITVSSQLYFVIIGMALFVIAMAVYMLGPISCAVVTCIGVCSLIRLRKDMENKSEKQI